MGRLKIIKPPPPAAPGGWQPTIHLVSCTWLVRLFRGFINLNSCEAILNLIAQASGLMKFIFVG